VAFAGFADSIDLPMAKLLLKVGHFGTLPDPSAVLSRSASALHPQLFYDMTLILIGNPDAADLAAGPGTPQNR
jgi:hypothetical protein